MAGGTTETATFLPSGSEAMSRPVTAPVVASGRAQATVAVGGAFVTAAATAWLSAMVWTGAVWAAAAGSGPTWRRAAASSTHASGESLVPPGSTPRTVDSTGRSAPLIRFRTTCTGFATTGLAGSAAGAVVTGDWVAVIATSPAAAGVVAVGASRVARSGGACSVVCVVTVSVSAVRAWLRAKPFLFLGAGVSSSSASTECAAPVRGPSRTGALSLAVSGSVLLRASGSAASGASGSALAAGAELSRVSVSVAVGAAPDPSGDAQATPAGTVTAVPIPSATARAPIRPIWLPYGNCIFTPGCPPGPAHRHGTGLVSAPTAVAGESSCAFPDRTSICQSRVNLSYRARLGQSLPQPPTSPADPARGRPPVGRSHFGPRTHVRRLPRPILRATLPMTPWRPARRARARSAVETVRPTVRHRGIRAGNRRLCCDNAPFTLIPARVPAFLTVGEPSAVKWLGIVVSTRSSGLWAISVLSYPA